VLAACDGVEAMEIFEANQDRIKCVILDLTMPRMDGEETLVEFAKNQVRTCG